MSETFANFAPRKVEEKERRVVRNKNKATHSSLFYNHVKRRSSDE